MPNTLNDAAAAPAALSAFLRGVERRAAVFAELQCGDREVGDSALAAAMRAFRSHAAALPMAGWPQRFWALLLAAPPLRRNAGQAQWPRTLSILAPLAPLERQALLLRLAAGLAEDQAAGVLGMSEPAYQQALAAACPRDAGGQPDLLAWRSLAEAIQQQLRDLPPERLARLAGIREDAISGSSLRQTQKHPLPARRAPVAQTQYRRWPWIMLVLVLCAAALAATWWWPQRPVSPLPDPSQIADGSGVATQVDIRSEALPVEMAASRFDAADYLPTHPDFELLMDDEGEAAARDGDFHAWRVHMRQALPVPDSATDAEAGSTQMQEEGVINAPAP